jgi:hypothetical protein
MPVITPALDRATDRWLTAGGSEGGLMAVAGWTRPDMLLRYTKARAQAHRRPPGTAGLAWRSGN